MSIGFRRGLAKGIRVGDNPGMAAAILRLISAGIMAAALCGCGTAGLQAPANYRNSPVAPARGEQWIEVITCYSYGRESHAMVRLWSGAEIVFWDPGGRYPAAEERTVERRRDVVEGEPGTLDQLFRYREKLSDNVMAVYGWRLSPPEFVRLTGVLRNPGREFDPEGLPMACAIKVSDFLRNLAPERIRPPRSTWSPDGLGRMLWTLQPDVVHIYRSGRPSEIWRSGSSALRRSEPASQHR